MFKSLQGRHLFVNYYIVLLYKFVISFCLNTFYNLNLLNHLILKDCHHFKRRKRNIHDNDKSVIIKCSSQFHIICNLYALLHLFHICNKGNVSYYLLYGIGSNFKFNEFEPMPLCSKHIDFG